MENATTIDKLDATYKKYLKKIKQNNFIADTTQSETISQVAENFPTKRDLKRM